MRNSTLIYCPTKTYMYCVIPKVQYWTYVTVTVINSLIYFRRKSYHGIEISRKFQYLHGIFYGNGIIYFDLDGNGIMQFLWKRLRWDWYFLFLTVTYELPITVENTAVFYRGNFTETSPGYF